MELEFKVNVEVREKGDKKTKWDLRSDLDGTQTLEDLFRFTKLSLLTIARDVLEEEQAKGFDKNPITLVDGKKNKPLESVNPLGKIQFISSKVQSVAVVEEVYQMILSRSKVITGTYIEAHFVYYNSQLVAKNLVELKSWLKTFSPIPKDVVRIVNVVPYARFLELEGVTAQRRKVKRVKSRDRRLRSGPKVRSQNGVYFLTSRAAQRLYKNNLGVYFGWISGGAISNEGWPVSAKNGKPFRRTFANGKRPKDRGPYVYPSIRLVFQERGTV